MSYSDEDHGKTKEQEMSTDPDTLNKFWAVFKTLKI